MTDKTTEALKLAEEALQDALSGWTYIQQSHGQLYGVGWERVETKGNEALAAISEALAEQSLGEYHGKLMREVCNKVITKTLAEPVKQEPVAWVNAERNTITWEKIYPNMEPLYAAPVSAKRECVELTDDEILAIAIQYDAEEGISDVEYGNRVIAAFKEKNK